MTSPKKWTLCLALTTLIMLVSITAANASGEQGTGTVLDEVNDIEATNQDGINDIDNEPGDEMVFALGEAETEAEAKATYIGGYEVGKTYRMKTTGYCSCKKCTGTSGASRTASGTWPKANHTISMGGVPFGTRVKMGGKTYVVEDRGGGVKGKHIDVYYSSHSTALKHGLKYMDVVILGKGGTGEKVQAQSIGEKEDQAAKPAPTKEPVAEAGFISDDNIQKRRVIIPSEF